MTPEQHKELRKPFAPEQIGKLPKPLKKDAEKGTCKECGKYHGLPAVHLDYVGHAATTDRLLSVDPDWTWEPLSLDEKGLPRFDCTGGLWIKLTVCGVTRFGYGDQTMGRGTKEIIGDAIRNAAMRFGVALDLWSKEDLLKDTDDPSPKKEKAQPPPLDPKILDAISRAVTEEELRIVWKDIGDGKREPYRQLVADRTAALKDG